MKILAQAVGRRKEAVAQVQIIKGTGQFIINNKSAQQYLQNNSCSLIAVKSPFILCELLSNSNQIGSSLKFPWNNPISSVLTEEEKNISLISSQKSEGLLNSVMPLPSLGTTFGLASGLGSTPANDSFPMDRIASSSFATPHIKDVRIGDPNNLVSSDSIRTTALKFSFEQIDTIVKVKGGGLIGQTEAIKLGVARALCNIKDFNSVKLTQGKGPLNGIDHADITKPKVTQASLKNTMHGLDTTEGSSHPSETLGTPYPSDSLAGASTHIKDIGAPLNLNKGDVSETNENLVKIENSSISLTSLNDVDKEYQLEKSSNLEVDLENLFKKQLKTKGYLTQDSRVKERRKYGLKKARKASQYHKR